MKLFLCLILFALVGCEVDEIEKRDTKCITHRGLVKRPDGTDRVHNSMEALLASHAAGADGTEFDIRHTKDGVPILEHDPNLNAAAQSRAGKNCNLNAEIKNLTWSEINENCELKNGESVVTFEQALSVLSKKMNGSKEFILLFDFKDMPEDTTIDLIRKYYNGRFDAVISIVTFATNLDALYGLRKKLPNALFQSGDGYVPGIENGFDGVEVRTISDIHARLLLKKGKELAVFDIDTAAEFKRFMNLEASYLTTDSLSECLSAKAAL